MMPPRFASLPQNAFPRLNALLSGIAPGAPPILMSVGEPQHPIPPFVAEIIAKHAGDFGRYPPINGTDDFRASVAGWITRRYGVTLDPARHILPLNGTREGLFSALFACVPEQKSGRRPAVLIPNPFYQCYAGAALAAGADPVYVTATRESGFLPDFSSVPRDVLQRTAAVYFCSPSNPEGAVASRAYWEQLFSLAEEFEFTVLADECYCDIYDETPPTGALEVRATQDAKLSRLLAFHSLSKRSSLPGIRSGFVAGDAALIETFRDLRNFIGPTIPIPIMAASAACWRDDAHVEANRALYRAKIGLAQRTLGNRFGFFRPPGGFFLWLEVGDSESAARTLWRDGGVKVLPGLYLARETGSGETATNPGRAFIRVALVNDLETTGAALERIARSL